MDDFENRRMDPKVRAVFVHAFELVEPFLNADGAWLSLADEYLAVQALQKAFPDMEGTRLFAVQSAAASVRASGRKPK
jgi:hypothetical protein